MTNRALTDFKAAFLFSLGSVKHENVLEKLLFLPVEQTFELCVNVRASTRRCERSELYRSSFIIL